MDIDEETAIPLLHEEPVHVMDQGWTRELVECGHGKDVSTVDPGTVVDVSADTDGFGRQRRIGTVHQQPGTGGTGSRRDHGPVPRRAGIPAVSSGDDDGVVALQLLPGDLFITSNGEGMQTASRFSGADRNAEAGPSHGEWISQTAFASVGGIVRASVAAVR